MKAARPPWIGNVVLLASLAVGYTVFSSMQFDRIIDFGGKSPDFSIPRIDQGAVAGSILSLSEFKGKFKVVNFWASWCEACKTEKDQLEQVQKELGSMGGRFLAIASYDKKEAALQALDIVPQGSVVGLDAEGEVAGMFKVASLPQTLVLDENGGVKRKYSRPLTDVDVAEIKKILAGEKVEIISEESRQFSKLNEGERQLTPFQLVDQSSEEFDSSRLQGKVWLANFVFSSCMSVCPMLSQHMQKLHDDFSANKDLKFVSITVDPKTDTPEVLAEYAKKYNADPGRWHFLTGDWEKIKMLIGEGFQLGVPDQPMFHTESFVLVDRDMKILGYYSANSPEEFKLLRKQLSKLN